MRTVRGSLKIARVSGIELKVHFSFLLVLAWGAFQWSAWGLRGEVFGALLSLLVFFCIGLHELGHSLVAQAFGIDVKDITFLPIGGVARLASRPKTPFQELLISLAGPAVNVVIASALAAAAVWNFGVVEISAAFQQLSHAEPSGLTLWLVLISSNIALAIFNMIPALPMDGGRVLRSVLAMVFGQRNATRASALLARLLAGGLLAVGIWLWFFAPQPQVNFLPIIAVFVFFGAGIEVREADFQQVLERIRSADAVNPAVPKFSPSTMVGEAMQAVVFWPTLAFAVQHSGRFVGIVSRDALIASAQKDGAWTYVSSLIDREPPVVRAHESLELARQRMMEREKPYAAVLDDAGALIGVVTDFELAHQLSVLEALERSKSRRSAPVPLGRS